MNPKLEKLITELNAQKAENRANHLKTLGLVDETKTVRKYVDWNAGTYEGYLYDEDKKQWYTETAAPIDITDEEYEELLKLLSETSIKKITPKKTTSVTAGFFKFLALLSILVGVVAAFAADNFFVLLYVVLVSPFLWGFAKIVEAADKYLSK